MHETEAERYRRDGGERAAGYREKAKQENPGRTVGEGQKACRRRRREKRQTGGVALRRVARADGKYPGTRFMQLRRFGARDRGARTVERIADKHERVLLGIDVEPRRARVNQQQRPAAVGRQPRAIATAWAFGSGQLVQQGQQLAGWIAGQ